MSEASQSSQETPLGQRLLDHPFLLLGAGLRGDRPPSVEEEVDVVPGEHAVMVTFTPTTAGGGVAALAFERRLTFVPGRVVLVTHDGAALVAR